MLQEKKNDDKPDRGSSAPQQIKQQQPSTSKKLYPALNPFTAGRVLCIWCQFGDTCMVTPVLILLYYRLHHPKRGLVLTLGLEMGLTRF